MRPFTFIKTTDSKQATAQKNTASQFIAGGTNLLDLMKKEIAQPEKLLDITTALPAAIQSTAKGISIGAMVRNSVIATSPEILQNFPLVAKAVLAGASPQIRNMASTGGNLLQRTRCPYFYDTTLPCNKRKPGSGCSALKGNNRTHAIVGWSDQCVAVHPSDLCVALAALDAVVITTDKAGKKSPVPFSNFHRVPGNTPDRDNNLPAHQLIHSIELVSNTFHKYNAYLKIRDRDSYAFALVSVAAALHIEGNKITGARLASGGVAHKPWRWLAAEQYLRGKKPSPATFKAAALIVAKETKPLKDNGYKVLLLQGAIETALQNCLTA